ncbi:MAG TPA: hypothetical protein VK087_01375 [Tissierellaceae bacterium]|nr:hypothetical protein [Tissierellaceae bacterium]
MDRSKRVIFISHCILNQNTVVPPLARAKGAYREIIERLMENGIGIHQMPCPEYEYLGLSRKPMSKLEYDTDNYRNLCKKIANDILKTIKEYLNNGYNIIGLVGIKGSPTCSIREEQGIFMEEVFSLLNSEGILLDRIDIPGEYVDGKDNSEFIKEFESFLTKVKNI